MKIRTGFVSNSSSCSFIINRYYLSQHQIDMILNHIDVAKDFYGEDINPCNKWEVEVTDSVVRIYTGMDIFFDMTHFLRNCVKVDSININVSDYHGSLIVAHI